MAVRACAINKGRGSGAVPTFCNHGCRRRTKGRRKARAYRALQGLRQLEGGSAYREASGVRGMPALCLRARIKQTESMFARAQWARHTVASSVCLVSLLAEPVFSATADGGSALPSAATAIRGKRFIAPPTVLRCLGHSITAAGLVVKNINTLTFAARDFWRRQGASDEHTLHGSGRSEQRRLRQKGLPPEGLRCFWLGAALLVGHSPTWGMFLPRALPQAKSSATNVSVFGNETTY